MLHLVAALLSAAALRPVLHLVAALLSATALRPVLHLVATLLSAVALRPVLHLVATLLSAAALRPVLHLVAALLSAVALRPMPHLVAVLRPPAPGRPRAITAIGTTPREAGTAEFRTADSGTGQIEARPQDRPRHWNAPTIRVDSEAAAERSADDSRLLDRGADKILAVAEERNRRGGGRQQTCSGQRHKE